MQNIKNPKIDTYRKDKGLKSKKNKKKK